MAEIASRSQDETHRPGRRVLRSKILAGVLLLLAFMPALHLAWTSRDMPQLGYFQDDGLYLIGAKSLAETGSYRILSLPDHPAQTKYPPLYPFLLSLVWGAISAVPDNLPFMLFATWIWLPLLLVPSWILFQSLGFGFRARTVLCCALVLNPVLAFLSINLMTEVMFTCLLITSLLVAERNAFLGGLTGGLAYLTRTAAAPLLVAVPVCFLIRKRGSSAGAFLVGMLPTVLGWTLWVFTHKASANDIATLYYTDYIGYHMHVISTVRLITMLLTNLDALLTGIGGLIIFSPSDTFLINFLQRILGMIAIVGTVRLARRIESAQIQVFAVVYSLMLVSWHFAPHERFTAPLLPIWLAGFATEVGTLFHLAKSSLRTEDAALRAAGALVSVGLAATMGVYLWTTFGAFKNYMPALIEARREQLAAIRKGFDWVSANLPANTGFVAYEDTVLYLYLDRPACRLVLPSNLFYDSQWNGILRQFKSIPRYAQSRKFQYVFWTQQDYHTDLGVGDRESIRQVLDKDSRLEPLYRSASVVVYRINGTSSR